MLAERSTTIGYDAHPYLHRCLDMSIADLEACLHEVSYPAEKPDLIKKGKLGGATNDVMGFLHLLPNGKYHGFNDIAFLAWSYLLV